MTVTLKNSILNSEASYCKPVPLNLERAHLDEGIVRGYAARFDKGFAPGAFKASLDAWRACGTLPHLTFNGDPGDVVGKWTSIIEDDTGLLVTGKIATSSPRGKLVMQELRNGIDGISAFFRVKDEDHKKCTQVHLTDVSLMREAAIPAAQASSALKFQNGLEFEGWLRNHGVAKAAARKLATGGWSKLAAGDEDKNDSAKLEALIQTLGLANFDLAHRR